MMELFVKISELLYTWALDPLLESYIPIYANIQHGGYGMSYGLLFLLVISLLAVLVYYLNVAKQLKNCSNKNYFTVFILGLVTLLVVNFVGFSCLIENTSNLFDSNLLCFELVDILYYTLLFEAFSWCVKGKSNDSNRSIFECFFPKNNKKNNQKK